MARQSRVSCPEFQAAVCGRFARSRRPGPLKPGWVYDALAARKSMRVLPIRSIS